MMHKTILHFSDIHFGGGHAPDRAGELLAEIERLRPNVVAVSGDLTQRAKSRQFRKAREFLDLIRAPLIVVPGNHDVPLWNVADRFLRPFDKYRYWITPDLNPIYVDEGLAVMGLNTARSFTIKGGEIDGKDLDLVRRQMGQLPSDLCKVLVAHHPLASPPGQEREKGVSGGRNALKIFEECGIEVVLTGHTHQSHAESSRDIYPDRDRHILLVQAGTVASLRGRGHERLKNSFNWIDVSARQIRVTHYVYSDQAGRFRPSAAHVAHRHHA
ncbi:MAG TPA: metallophosphoesterase family protein [Blastocatellia bacterium]|nr:metallophosphoesterase family protein [Blastocatellia bacterium]